MAKVVLMADTLENKNNRSFVVLKSSVIFQKHSLKTNCLPQTIYFTNKEMKPWRIYK